MTAALSDFRLQVAWTRLLSVVEEQAQTLIRTAFSATVRDAGDLSCAVFDTRGRLLAEAVTGTPGHVNSMAEGVKHFLKRYPIETMTSGDHYITNDPWMTSGHLHDITVVSPVFNRGELVGLLGCCCHQVDIGGLGQGPDARSIYEEGLQIPILKLVSAGRINEDLMEILRVNVRTPLQAEGDVMSYIAANETGARRLCAMLDEFQLDGLGPVADYIIDRSLAATRREIAKLPKGTWRSEIVIDGYADPITLRAAVTIGDHDILVDYEGTDDAVPHGVNVVLNYCKAYTIFGLKCVVSPDVPNNAGALAPFRVQAPIGSVLNVQRPWPVAARHMIGQMLPDLIFGCLDQALPSRIPAEGSSCLWVVQLRGQTLSATGDPRSSETFDTVFMASGGSGARRHQDGLSATAFPSGVKAMPVEVIEAAAPIVIWRKELRADSGGAGRQRGGVGQIVEVGSRDGCPFQVLAMFERVTHPASGRDEGLDGATGVVRLASGGSLRAKGLQDIPADDRLVLETAGGGGLGNPAGRNRLSIAEDIASGLLTVAAAERDYGWREQAGADLG
jgi:N-methylhydantoinase B